MTFQNEIEEARSIRNRKAKRLRKERKQRDQLQSFLKRQEDRLRAELRDIPDEKRLNEADHDLADIADHARCGHENVVNEGVLSSRSALRRSIENALRRITTGTYGKCAECKGEIPREILERMPAATLCSDCQEEESIEESARKAALREQIQKGAYLVCL